MHVVGDNFLSYNCAYILNSEIAQVCSSRPIGGRVYVCVHAHGINLYHFYICVRD